MMSGKVSIGKVRSSICLPQEGCTPDGVYQQSALDKHSGGLAVKRDRGRGDDWERTNGFVQKEQMPLKVAG